MNYKKYAALFLAGTVSAVVSAEAYATPTTAIDQQEEERFFTSATVTSSHLVHSPQVFSRTVSATEEIPTFTSETELVNYIIENAKNLEQGFEARFVGDTSDLIVKEKLFNLIQDAVQTDDYLYGIGTSIGYGASFTSKEADLTFTASYLISKEEQAFVDSEVARINAQILNPGMTDLEKVIAINEYIVKNTTYSFYASPTPHAAYALFNEGKGVCQAYAMAAYHMFKAAGLETHYVTGYAGESHAWNLVKVNGEWYHIDPTWNDPTFSKSLPGLENFISYQYFLLSDETLLAERTMDSRPNLPQATSKYFEIFRSIESIPFNYNNVQYMLLPEYANNQFFYVNYNDNYAIDTLNLAKQTLAIERLANVRAMDILATHEALYFVDIDKKLGLSKIDLQTKAVTNLYSGSTVTSIKLENGVVNAYNNAKVVYSEKTGQSETPKPIPTSQQVLAVIAAINKLDNTAVTFIEDVKSVQQSIDYLNADEQLQITNFNQFKIASTLATQYSTDIKEIITSIEQLDQKADVKQLQASVTAIQNILKAAPAAVNSAITNLDHLRSIEAYIQEQETANTDISKQIEQITNLVNDIIAPSKQFETQAATLQTLLAKLTVDIENHVNADVIEKITYVQQQYKKMTQLAFPQTTSWSATQIVLEPKKSWTVSLSLEVANTKENKEKISVVDMFGDAVNVTVTINNNKITVTPNQSYVEGVPYTLVIASGLQSAIGTTLPNGTHMQFMFEK